MSHIIPVKSVAHSDAGEDGYSDQAARVLAFYLPQFHPIKENNEWWGPGFTEWTNVAKAKPLFRGHYQPHLPADLGFYDLRVPEVREHQARLARGSGVEGFIYWHYWFGNGRRILERPFDEVLRSGSPDFPFCLAWANQSWTGIWHGNPKSVLIKQEYPGPEDDASHFRVIEKAFRDPRYVTVDNKPVFVLLDPQDHPDPAEFVRRWRSLAEQAGFPGLYLIAMWNGGLDPRLNGFDGVSAYGPGDFIQPFSATKWKRRWHNARHGDFGPTLNKLIGQRFLAPQRFSYSDVVETAFTIPLATDRRFIPTVLPNWDNTPRSGKRGVVFERSTPELFSAYLRKAIHLARVKPPSERLLFIKAWNEWAEGNYLEPDAAFGCAYLDALRGAIKGSSATDAHSSASGTNSSKTSGV